MYYAMMGREHVETDRRPTTAELRTIKGPDGWSAVRAQTKPGDGWHLSPGPPVIAQDCTYWYRQYMSSEGAVLAHVVEIWKATSVDFNDITQKPTGLATKKPRRSLIVVAESAGDGPRRGTPARRRPTSKLCCHSP